MNININKGLVVDTALTNQKTQIENIEQRINAINKDAFSNDHSASQSESRTAGKLEILNALQSELTFAIKELEFLKTIDASDENTSVSPGAIVITEQMIFFIGISNDKIQIDGNEIICISTKAPIYAAMKGLKKGDMFEYNKTKYSLKNIY